MIGSIHGRWPPDGVRALGLSVAAVLTMTSTPARGAAVTFHPSVALGLTYTDNVGYVGDAGSDTADSAGTLAISLPLEREFKRGELTFDYSAGLTSYRSFSELNYVAHNLSLGYHTQPGKRSTLGCSMGYALGQDQGQPDLRPGDEVTLSQRAEWRTLSANVDYGHSLGRRWSIDLGLGAVNSDVEPVEAVDPTAGALDVESRTTLNFEASASAEVGRRTSLGLGYVHARAELDQGIDENVDGLNANMSRRLAEHTDVRGRVGVYLRSRTAESSAEAQTDDGGVEFGFGLTHGQPEAPQLAVDLSLRPSAGGILEGTSTDLNLSVSISDGIARSRWGWSTNSGYTRRDPTDETQPVLDTVAVAGSVERDVGSDLGARLTVSWGKQRSDQPNDPANEGSFVAAGTYIVWYPRGRSR